MTDESINASDGQEKPIIDALECKNLAQCTRYFGGCGITVCFNANNGFDSDANPVDTIETEGA